MLECGKLYTEDGKLVIYIQNDKTTDPSQRQDWLPAHDGPFSLQARLYWPEQIAVKGTWTPPSVLRIWKIGHIQRGTRVLTSTCVPNNK